ncbi:MAG TPA: hypothetical protein VKA84_03675 [Gemmatimonadaceae bacterium]|nr:hypothetical protein [Gemmatimonadaceae bacterium]
MSARRSALAAAAAAALLPLLPPLAACGGRGGVEGTTPNAASPELAALAAVLDTATARGGALAGVGLARVVLVDTVVRSVSSGAGLDPTRFPTAYALRGAAVRRWAAPDGQRRFAPAAFEYRTPGLDTALVILSRDAALDANDAPRAHFALLLEAAGSQGVLTTVVLAEQGGRWGVVKLEVLGQ